MPRSLAVHVAVAAALSLAAAPSAAQPAPAPAACGYDRCALKRERIFLTERMLAGVDGRRVADRGFSGYALEPLLAGNGRALAEVRVHRREARLGNALATVGTVLQVVALVDAARNGRRDGSLVLGDITLGNTAMVLGGVALQVGGAWRLQISDRALNRAVWWYNRDLPR